MGHRISGVEPSISENGIANTSVCVPGLVSGGNLIHDGTVEVRLRFSTRIMGMGSVLTTSTINDMTLCIHRILNSD